MSLICFKKKSALSNEDKGKKACRLIGVSLKNIDYQLEQIAQKLKEKKAELDILFSDFTLTDMEMMFLTAFQQLRQDNTEEIIPLELNRKIGLPATFVKTCIKKAMKLNKYVAAADFLLV